MSDKYIPKVGEEFNHKHKSAFFWESSQKCTYASDRQIGFTLPNGLLGLLHMEYCEFRPIPTKADVEREELGKIIFADIELAKFQEVEIAVRAIQAANYTKRPVIERDDILYEVMSFSRMLEKENINITEAVCDLLKQNGIEVVE